MFKDNLNFAGTKALDFEAFSECMALINNKEYLNELGYNKLIAIKKTMNYNRIYIDTMNLESSDEPPLFRDDIQK